MYSAGIVPLQMLIPSLRSTSRLKNFNTELRNVEYDLKKWREKTRMRPDLSILDLDSGRGWDLATRLISERGFLRRGRLSAAAALRHPYFLLGGFNAFPKLRKRFVSCQPNSTVNQLREHVAHEIRSLAEDIEIMLVNNTGISRRDVPTCLFPDASLQILQGQDTLARISGSCSSLNPHLIIAYRLKKKDT